MCHFADTDILFIGYNKDDKDHNYLLINSNMQARIVPFQMYELILFGEVVSRSGIQTDPSKSHVQNAIAIHLGIMSYVSKHS